MPNRPKNRKDDSMPSTASMIAAAADYMRDRKDSKYQDALEQMGMMEDGGGRAKVPSKKRNTNYMDKPKPRKMKKGGAAFPDLTGDGKVTKKDILRGRGVRGFKSGGEVCRGGGAAVSGTKFSGVK